MRQGMIHIYCGDGKGKTTASIGLSVRMAGNGGRVLFVQFFKNGDSSEIAVLRSISGIQTMHAKEDYGRFAGMDKEMRSHAAAAYGALLQEAIAQAGEVDLLVLDESISAYNHAMIPQAELLDFLRHKPGGLEVVLTGRNPAPALVALADYVSEVKKIKHPYDEGALARPGIEF